MGVRGWGRRKKGYGGKGMRDKEKGIWGWGMMYKEYWIRIFRSPWQPLLILQNCMQWASEVMSWPVILLKKMKCSSKKRFRKSKMESYTNIALVKSDSECIDQNCDDHSSEKRVWLYLLVQTPETCLPAQNCSYSSLGCPILRILGTNNWSLGHLEPL